MFQHLDKDILTRYYRGDLPEREIAPCEKHLVDCNLCRNEFASLVRLMDDNVSDDEAAILDQVEATLAKPAFAASSVNPVGAQRPSWFGSLWNLAAVAASIVLIVAATWAFFFNHSPDSSAPVAAAQRTLEARLSGQPYSEFIRTRVGSVSHNGVSTDDQLKRLSTNHHEIGRFYLEHDEFSEAVAQLEDAKGKQPDSVEVRNDLGVACMESGSEGALDKAVTEFKRALELNPRYAPARFNLALAYERLGDFSRAEEELNRYLQIDPGSDWAKEVKSKLQLWKH
jgi:tetratricopeptide (TPR) repeat protein